MKYTNELRNYITNNLKEIPFPQNIYQSYNFQNPLDRIIDLLIKLLDFDVDDGDINRVKGNFEKDCKDLIMYFDINSDSAISDIEKTGAHFEGFLKKIAYLNPANKIYWNDSVDIDIEGIKETMLNDLITGKILKKKGIRGNKLIPSPLVAYNDETKDILDFVRGELRNALHQAKEERNDTLLTIYRKAVIGVYLIAVDTNFQFLEIFDLIPYLNSIVAKIENEPTFPTKRYTDLDGEENIDLINDDYADREIEEDVSVFDENVDYDEDYNEGEEHENEDEEVTESEAENDYMLESQREKRKGKISELRQTVNQMIIRGNPGMGKTTTIRYLVLSDARKQENVPFLFYLKSYQSHKGDIIAQIAQNNAFDPTWLNLFLNRGDGTLFLDGLNEIIDPIEREYLKADIEKLASKGINMVVSSRRKAYDTDRFKIPVFDLQPLELRQIIEYVRKSYGRKKIELQTDGISVQYTPETFAELLQKNTKLYTLCRNPFFLRMYVDVVRQTQQFAENTGLLLRTFVRGNSQNVKSIGGLLGREERKHDKSHWRENRSKYETLIQYLAYETRWQKTVSFSRMSALELMSEPNKRYFGSSVDLDKLIEDLKDLYLLEENGQQLSFVHELYQEYFAAEALINKYEFQTTLITTLASESNWVEPIILFDGLLQNNIEVFKQISAVNCETAARILSASLSYQIEKREINLRDALQNANNFTDVNTSARGFRALLYLGEHNTITEIVKQVMNPSYVHKEIMEAIAQNCAMEQLFDFLWILRDLEGKTKQLLKWVVNGIVDEVEIENMEGKFNALIEYWLEKPFYEEFAVDLFKKLKKLNFAYIEVVIKKAIKYDRLTTAAKLIEKYQLQEKYPIDFLIDRAIKKQQLTLVEQWVEKYELQEKYSIDFLIVKSLNTNQLALIKQWVEKYKLQEKYPIEFLINKAVEKNLITLVEQWIIKHKLQEKFSTDFLIDNALKKQQFNIAEQWIEKYKVQEKYPIEFLISKAFETDQLSLIQNWVIKYQLQTYYPIDSLINRALEINQLTLIEKWIIKYQLQEKYPIDFLIDRALVTNQLVFAERLIEKYQLEGKFPIDFLIGNAIEKNQYPLAIQWIEKYHLKEKYSAELLVEKILDTHWIVLAILLIEKNQLEEKYPVNFLVERAIERNQLFVAEDLIKKHQLQESYTAQFLIGKALERNQLETALQLAERYDLQEEYINTLIETAIKDDSIKLAKRLTIRYNLEDQYPNIFIVKKNEKVKLLLPLEVGISIINCEILKIIKSHVIVRIIGDSRKASVYINELHKGYIQDIFTFRYNGSQLEVGQILEAKVIAIDNKNRVQLSLRNMPFKR